jgi:hypothetical protein
MILHHKRMRTSNSFLFCPRIINRMPGVASCVGGSGKYMFPNVPSGQSQTAQYENCPSWLASDPMWGRVTSCTLRNTPSRVQCPLHASTAFCTSCQQSCRSIYDLNVSQTTRETLLLTDHLLFPLLHLTVYTVYLPASSVKSHGYETIT